MLLERYGRPQSRRSSWTPLRRLALSCLQPSAPELTLVTGRPAALRSLWRLDHPLSKPAAAPARPSPRLPALCGFHVPLARVQVSPRQPSAAPEACSPSLAHCSRVQAVVPALRARRSGMQ